MLVIQSSKKFIKLQKEPNTLTIQSITTIIGRTMQYKQLSTHKMSLFTVNKSFKFLKYLFTNLINLDKRSIKSLFKAKILLTLTLEKTTFLVNKINDNI
jgi:hypothetical protein